MAHDDRRDAAAGTAIVAVDVAATDAAGLDLDEDIFVTDFRCGHVAELEIFRVFEDQGLHDSKDNL